MSWKIVPDSAADLPKDYIPVSDAIIEEVPLTISVEGQEFIDDHNLNTSDLINAFNDSEFASNTACPSPQAYLNAFTDGNADKIIVITLSKNLSGSNNSAKVAKQMAQEKFPEKEIKVIDSHATGGTELLLIEKADELIAQELPFSTVIEKLEEYRDNLETLFTLGQYSNLIKNGRLNKFVGRIAQTFNIRIVGKETNGKLDLLYKVRGEAKAIKKLVTEMGQLKNMDNVNVVILHTFNSPGATVTKNLIKKTYPNVGNIQIFPTGAINSYYAEEEGLIVSF